MFKLSAIQAVVCVVADSYSDGDKIIKCKNEIWV